MSSNKERFELLGAVPLLQGATRDELRAVSGAAKEVEHREGDVIVREGQTGVGFHLIIEGQARVTVGGELKARLAPGDFFGELALLDGGPRSATVTAETNLRTLSLTSWEFRPIVEQSPSLAYKLLLHLCKRLREAERKSTDLEI